VTDVVYRSPCHHDDRHGRQDDYNAQSLPSLDSWTRSRVLTLRLPTRDSRSLFLATTSRTPGPRQRRWAISPRWGLRPLPLRITTVTRAGGPASPVSAVAIAGRPHRPPIGSQGYSVRLHAHVHRTRSRHGCFTFSDLHQNSNVSQHRVEVFLPGL